MPFNPDDLHAVIFDMDGILIDSEILYQKAAMNAAKELGFPLSRELQLRTVGLAGDATEHLLRTEMGEEFPFEEYNINLRQVLATQLMAHVPVKPGVRELLGFLNSHEIPTAVATSTGHEAAHHHLNRADLAQHFDTIITRDDVDNGKPHPEPYLLAAERLEVEPENCLALEDSHNGVRSAHGAGMQTIMVPDLLPATDEMRLMTIAIMDDLHLVRARFEAG
jgi:HAD superfamily hydrolase (TIGR01509 family)